MRLVAALLALTLAACASAIPASSPMPDGQAASPPAGWTDYCRRSPADPSC